MVNIPVTNTPASPTLATRLVELENFAIKMRQQKQLPYVYLKLKNYHTQAGLRGLVRHVSWWVVCFHEIRTWYNAGKLSNSNNKVFDFKDWGIEDVILTGYISMGSNVSRHESFSFDLGYKNPWQQARIRDILCFLSNMTAHLDLKSKLTETAKREWITQVTNMTGHSGVLYNGVIGNIRMWPKISGDLISPIAFKRDNASFTTPRAAVIETPRTNYSTRTYKPKTKICFFSRQQPYEGEKDGVGDSTVLQDRSDCDEQGWWGCM